MGHYRFDPQQAGGLATLFLAAAVIASVVLAPVFARLPRRAVSVLGFGVAAAAFFGATVMQGFAGMAALHVMAGLAAGASLSVTHGTIARSANPHRLFAIVGMALGVFAVAFFAVVPTLLAKVGGAALFQAFAAVMAFAAVVALVAFPQVDGEPAAAAAPAARPAPLPGLTQAMTFAFLERVGNAREFGPAAVTGVLVALSIVNLFPAAFAAVTEKRWSARGVLLTGPVLQALLVALIMQSTVFAPYAAAASVFAAVMIFTHTFAFGLLARLETSGRALAATPAMLMTGAAIGPVLGGTLVKFHGYGSLALAAALIAAIAVFCFSRLPAPGVQGAAA
jgi:predicted MFS family arabinose efflux permease